MAKVIGVAGIFIKCDDVVAYQNWWKTHIGLDISDWGTFEWENPSLSRSMFSPFKGETDYFEPSKRSIMMNLQVIDVATLIEKAKNGGAKIIGDIEKNEFGTFGWFIDPEGYKIELWEAPSA